MNPFEAKFRKFTESLQKNYSGNHAEAISTKSGAIFKDKPFTEEYRTVYAVTGWGQILAQVVTFATTAGLGVFALQHIIPADWGLWVAAPLALLFAVGVEAIKRSTLAIAAKHLLKYKSFGFAGIVAALVMCVSIAAALFGAKELPGVFYPEPKRSTDPAAVAAISADLDRVQADIQRLQSGLSADRNWVAENRTLPKLQKERAALAARRDDAMKAAEGRADAAHLEAVAQRAAKVDRMQTYSVAAAIIAELVFLACTWFMLYYLWRAFAEMESEQEAAEVAVEGAAAVPIGKTAAPITQAPPAYNGHEIAPPPGATPITNERRPIGFFQSATNATVTNATVTNHMNKECAHCGTPFTAKVDWQKFCRESCKLAYHEAKHGQPFEPGKSRYKKKAVST